MSPEATNTDMPAVTTQRQDTNYVELEGVITSLPELRTMEHGDMRGTIQIATRRVYTTNGDTKNRDEFHHIVAWNSVARLLRDLKPGDRVSVFGRLQTRTWSDKDTGVKQAR